MGYTSIDGEPLKPGHVLVPIWIQDGYKLPAESKKHLTTYHFGEFKFRIGFMQIPIEKIEDYIKSFWKEIREYLAERREGRCVIGHKSNGEPICCSKSKKCTKCTEKYDHERYNPLKDRYQILSLEFCFEDEGFDYVDKNAVDPEKYVIAQEEPLEDEQYDFVIAHFEKTMPRYATIIKLGRKRVPVENIIAVIGLNSSRGYEEINNAYNALCEFLNLSCYKIKKKPKKK